MVDTDGKLLGSFAGYKEGKDFIAAVDALKDPEMNPERVKERYRPESATANLFLPMPATSWKTTVHIRRESVRASR